MLEMRPNCECCDCDLPPDANQAMICSFECTFCQNCAEDEFHGACPNCGGELMPRPLRPAVHWATHPPSTQRIHREAACAHRPA
jgi:hypothetical protein